MQAGLLNRIKPIPNRRGASIVRGDLLLEVGLLCSYQTRLLAFHAAQSVLFAKPAIKNADTAAFLPPQTTAAMASSPIQQSKQKRDRMVSFLFATADGTFRLGSLQLALRAALLRACATRPLKTCHRHVFHAASSPIQQSKQKRDHPVSFLFGAADGT